MVDERDKARARLGLPPVPSTPAYNYNPLPQSSPSTPAAPARSAAKEKEALSVVSQEYINSRGGINAQGYYNDVPVSAQLTAAEQKQVRNPDGTTDTFAMAKILQEKQIKELVSTGLSVADATNRVSSQYGEYGVPKIGGSTASTGTLGTTPTSGMTAGSVNAIAAIAALLSSYGLGDLSASITEAVQKGYTSDTIQLIMQDPNSKDPLALAFQTRFPANKTRLAAGKSVLSAAEYLAAERTYTQVLQSYGASTLATKDRMNSFIANDISAAEVSDRVGLAVDRVRNADPFTKAALAEYYPMLNQADIVAAVLDPAEGLPALKRKVQVSEIGGAAAVQGLKTGLGSMSETSKQFENVTTGALGAEALASFGISQEEARKGYQTVASIAPRSEFLSSISTGEDYTRLQAEQEAFLGLASAKRARESLTALEEGRFKGQSGLTKTSLTNKGAGQY
jgi:hypothetical protein